MSANLRIFEFKMLSFIFINEVVHFVFTWSAWVPLQSTHELAPLIAMASFHDNTMWLLCLVLWLTCMILVTMSGSMRPLQQPWCSGNSIVYIELTATQATQHKWLRSRKRPSSRNWRQAACKQKKTCVVAPVFISLCVIPGKVFVLESVKLVSHVCTRRGLSVYAAIFKHVNQQGKLHD